MHLLGAYLRWLYGISCLLAEKTVKHVQESRTCGQRKGELRRVLRGETCLQRGLRGSSIYSDIFWGTDMRNRREALDSECFECAIIMIESSGLTLDCQPVTRCAERTRKKKEQKNKIFPSFQHCGCEGGKLSAKHRLATIWAGACEQDVANRSDSRVRVHAKEHVRHGKGSRLHKLHTRTIRKKAALSHAG